MSVTKKRKKKLPPRKRKEPKAKLENASFEVVCLLNGVRIASATDRGTWKRTMSWIERLLGDVNDCDEEEECPDCGAQYPEECEC